jgi:hypothetical protein
MVLHDMQDIADREFAHASDSVLKSLRAIFLMTGRSPDEAVVDAVTVVAALMENGGAGWIERLIDAQASAQLRMMARIAARDLEAREVDARTRSRVLLLCLARQAMSAEVFDAVAARAH